MPDENGSGFKLTRRNFQDITDLENIQNEKEDCFDEYSPNRDQINELVPKVSRLIEKKQPTHLLSPQRSFELSRLSMNWHQPGELGIKSYIETPTIGINFSNFTEHSLERQNPVGNSGRRTAWTYRTPTKKYPKYLDEDRNFTYVANWARIKTGGRVTTYVAQQYRDDRVKPKRATHHYKNSTGKPVSKSARYLTNQMNTSNSTEDYTKRKVRRGHFKAEEIEVEVHEVDLFEDEEGSRSSKHIQSLSMQKDLGYWCPNCYQFSLTDEEVESHVQSCQTSDDQGQKYIKIVKKKFSGFCKALEECYEKATIENNKQKRKNFFDTGPSMFLQNLVEVFDKIYDRYSNRFYKVNHLKLLTKKVDALCKEVSRQEGEYSYVYTIAIKAKEIMEEYLAFRT